ncbi:hypothetical protein M434DRAFT_205683 [Hypoxylon sp. CO27-5]|nr:hypothetical protein M434DRAFT_205683 [Hypoxylon sp. CO27-5]
MDRQTDRQGFCCFLRFCVWRGVVLQFYLGTTIMLQGVCACKFDLVINGVFVRRGSATVRKYMILLGF